MTRVAFVTGAASGMGRATAQRFADEGARVFGVDVDEGGLEKAAAEIRESGGQIETSTCNVASRDECFAAVAAAIAAAASQAAQEQAGDGEKTP